MKQLKKRVCVLLSTFAARNFDFILTFILNFNNMRKTYQFMVALVVFLLCAATTTAGERVPLTKDMVYAYTGWGINAVKGGLLANAVCDFETPGTTVFGDPSCDGGVDLGGC